MDAVGSVLHETDTSIEVFPQPAGGSAKPVQVVAGSSLEWLPPNLVPVLADVEDLRPGETAVCSGPGPIKEQWSALLRKVREGARVIVLNPQPGTWELGDAECAVIEACGMGPRHFVSRATGHSLVNGFQSNDFRLWYDDEQGRIAPLLNNLIVGAGGCSILSSGQLAWGKPLTVADAVREYAIGEGTLILCCLELKGRLSNPIAREFLERLVQPSGGEERIAGVHNLLEAHPSSNFHELPVLNQR